MNVNTRRKKELAFSIAGDCAIFFADFVLAVAYSVMASVQIRFWVVLVEADWS